MSTMPNRSGRPPGQRYLLMPEDRRIRAWWVADNGQLERGPSGLKPRNLRNMLTRQGHHEMSLMDIAVEAVAVVPADGRL
jgi:hypothetical protein